MTESEKRYLTGHDAHDFDALRERWETVAKEGCLVDSTLFRDGDFPVLACRTGPLAGRAEGPAFYFCAGVHGDEPAGVWGLLEWAEGRIDWLREKPALIFPCFNPWGLVNNRRSDSEGRDLNRLFHRTDLPLIAAWRKLAGTTQFDLALHFHEDYDARGSYVYELTEPDLHFAETGLAACESIIPRETRPEVDGNAFENGILRRSGGLEKVVEEELDGGYPEAIYVFLKHARSALTFETPSEFSLYHRVRAQRAFIDAVVDAV